MYAILYFAVHELTFVCSLPFIAYYGRYIDDGIAVLIPPDDDPDLKRSIATLQTCLDSFGPL